MPLSNVLLMLNHQRLYPSRHGSPAYLIAHNLPTAHGAFLAICHGIAANFGDFVANCYCVTYK